MALTELSEQIIVVRKLRAAQILFCAVPNGGLRDPKAARMLKASGVQPGVPDLLVFDPPPKKPKFCGVAIEMKRTGATKSSLRPAQKQWLAALADRGWLTVVAFGAEDALRHLHKLGYPIAPVARA